MTKKERVKLESCVSWLENTRIRLSSLVDDIDAITEELDFLLNDLEEEDE